MNPAYDPLTQGSYENPNSPWAGIDGTNNITSLGMGRLENLVRAYVERRICGCSVLIGGDRGAGKTSMVLKVIERLRSNGRHNSPQVAFNPAESLTFPRPLPVRIHGPALFDDTSGDARIRSLRLFTQAIHRALCDELGEMLRGRAANDPARAEKAAHYLLELESSPRASRIREIWASFSLNSHPQPLLPGRGTQSDPDQAYREMLAFETSAAMCRDIRSQTDGEQAERSSKLRDPASGKPDDEVVQWVRMFANFMKHGGHLLNPLAGFIVGVLIFVTVVKEMGSIPIPLVLALLAAFSTTVLLNFAAAKHHVEKLMIDSSFVSLERTLPVLIDRLELAGLFPILIVDELDKVKEEEGADESCPSSLFQHLDNLARDLKSFVADQAFVCFLVPRRFYEDVRRDSSMPASQRNNLDTFFTDRVLVTFSPKELLTYLDRRIELLSGPHQVLEFLKHLYLFRAQGHLADLQECISAEQTPGGRVYLAQGARLDEVPVYKDHLFFQDAVRMVVEEDQTLELLRQHPDLREPLNQVLYGAARLWEKGRSFTAKDLLLTARAQADDSRIDFGTQVDFLISYLESPFAGIAVPGRTPVPFAPPLQPLISANSAHGELRYYWQRPYHATKLAPADDPSHPKFRSDGERDFAVNNLKALAEFLSGLGEMNPLDLATPLGLIRHSPPSDLTWDLMLRGGPRALREFAEFHQATIRDVVNLRYALLAACLSRSATDPLLNRESWALMLAPNRSSSGWQGLDFEAQRLTKLLKGNRNATPDILTSVDLFWVAENHDIVSWCREALVLLGKLRRL